VRLHRGRRRWDDVGLDGDVSHDGGRLGHALVVGRVPVVEDRRGLVVEDRRGDRFGQDTGLGCHLDVEDRRGVAQVSDGIGGPVVRDHRGRLDVGMGLVAVIAAGRSLPTAFVVIMLLRHSGSIGIYGFRVARRAGVDLVVVADR
jgi:hypothetical protein